MAELDRMEKTFAKLEVGDILIADGTDPWPRTVITAPEQGAHGDVILRVRYENKSERAVSMPARGRHVILRPRK